MQRVVLSIGGSLINPGKPDVKFLKNIAALIVKLKAKFQLAILCGGGQPARDYASAVRGFGGNEFVADEAAPRMPEGVRVVSVTTWESEKCAATYTPKA